MNIFGFNFLGPSIPEPEKHLNWAAGLGKTSPIDSTLLNKAKESHLGLLKNYTLSTATGLKKTTNLFFKAVIMAPMIPWSSGPSIYGEAEAVCTPLAESRVTLSNYSLKLLPAIYSGLKSIIDTVEGLGIRVLSPFQRASLTTTTLALPQAEKGWKWLNWIAKKLDLLTYYECMADHSMGSGLYPQRMHNYLAALIKYSDKIWNSEYTPYLFSTFSIVFAAYAFYQNQKEAEKNRVEVIEELKERFNQMALTFEYLTLGHEEDTESWAKALQIAKGLLIHKSHIEKELESLDVKGLSPLDKKTLLMPLFKRAQKLLDKERMKIEVQV